MLKVGSNHRLKQSKNDWIVVPNTHEPIVTQDVFDKAQAILGLKRERSSYVDAGRLFAGKVKCGTCGHAMRGRYDRVLPFFFCETTRIKKTGCIADKVYEDDLSDLVLAFIRKYAEMALCADSILVQLQANINGDIAKIVANISSLQEEIEKAKSSKIALYESYREGKLTKDKYVEEKNSIEGSIAKLQNRLESLKFEMETLQGEQRQNQFVDSFKGLLHLKELTPQLVNELVANIKINTADDISITWNFEDDYQRVVSLLEAKTR